MTSAARKIPSGSPRAAPISAVITLSWRIIRRAWRRVIPIARSIPISRVRSKTESTSVLTIPKRLTMTESVEHHVEEREELVEVGVLAFDPLLPRLHAGVGEPGDRRLDLRPVVSSVGSPATLTNV